MILLIAPVSGRLSDRFGSRWFMAAGTSVLAVGLLLVERSQPGSSYAGVILPSMLVMGGGMAMTMAPMTAAVMASVPPARAGDAGGAGPGRGQRRQGLLRPRAARGRLRGRLLRGAGVDRVGGVRAEPRAGGARPAGAERRCLIASPRPGARSSTPHTG